MVVVIRAIVLAAIAQVIILAVLVSYLFIHADNMSQVYAAISERNSAHYTDEVVRDQYNGLQLQFQSERDSLHEYIDKRVDLKISQAIKGIKP